MDLKLSYQTQSGQVHANLLYKHTTNIHMTNGIQVMYVHTYGHKYTQIHNSRWFRPFAPLIVLLYLLCLVFMLITEKRFNKHMAYIY